MGNRWAGNGNGEGKRRGEGVSLQATWDQSERIAPHAKEGFQVSKRDSGTGEGYQGVVKGVIKGLLRELCHVLSYNVKPVYIVLLCVCRANKRIVFRL
jgi:hypothetical protein